METLLGAIVLLALLGDLLRDLFNLLWKLKTKVLKWLGSPAHVECDLQRRAYFSQADFSRRRARSLRSRKRELRQRAALGYLGSDFKSAEAAQKIQRVNDPAKVSVQATGDPQKRKRHADNVENYRSAALQNDASAQFLLGHCYFNGLGVMKDECEAVRWFRKAAEQNFAKAQLILGLCYYHGDGLERDHAKSADWFQKAAMQNNAEAQFSLGNAYSTGEGVPKCQSEAFAWYLIAAAKHDRAAKSRDSFQTRMTRHTLAKGQRRAQELLALFKSGAGRVASGWNIAP